MKPLPFSTLLHQNDVALTSFDLIYRLYRYQLRHTGIRTQSVAISDGNCAHIQDERIFAAATYTMLNSAPLKV